MREISTVPAYGQRVAGRADGREWAVAYGDWVTLWDGIQARGELPRAPERALDLRYDGDALLAAPSRAAGGEWEPLVPLYRATDPLQVVTATWAGDRVLAAVAETGEGREQQVRLYDGRTREPGPVLWVDSEWMRVEAVEAGGARLAAAALEVRIFDADGRDLKVIGERGKQVRRLRFAGDHLVVGYADGHLAVDDGPGWQAHADEACAVAVHPAGDRIATGGWDARVALWRLDGELLAEVQLVAAVADVAFLGDDRLLALHRLPAQGVSVLALS